MMEDSCNLLKSALIALNGGTLSPPFESFNDVNSWLNDFRQTHEAWMVCMRVCNECESPVIQYSCVSLLVRKVQHDWALLQNPKEKETYRNIFLQMYAAQLSSDSMDTLLIRQIVLLLVLSIDTLDEMNLLLQGACASLGEELQHPTIVYASIEMLLTLAVEFRDGSRRAHAGLLPALKEKSSFVMALLEERMVVSQSHDDASRLCSVAKAWIELPSIAGGYNETDIVSFSEQYPRAFNFLVTGCFANSLESGRDSILLLLKGTSIDDDYVPQAFLRIFHKIASILIGCRDSICGVNRMTDSQALVVALVGSALADCWPDGIARSMGPECVDLAKVMVECIKRSEECVVEASLEYFFAMNLTDIKDRIEELQRPFMTHLVQTLAERLMYPSQDDCDIIEYEDRCGRLRKDLVPELLQELFPALNTWYVEYAVQGMKVNIWQQVEISMYLLQSVDLQIRTQVLAHAESGPAKSMNMMLCDGFQTVSHWLTSLVTQDRGDQVAIVGSQFCQTITSFSIWFSKVHESPLRDVLATLMTIISLPEQGLGSDCTHIACAAVRSLSIRAGERLVQEHEITYPLLESIKAAAAHHVPGEEDLVEAAVRISSRVENNNASRDWLVQILRPYAETLNQLSSMDIDEEHTRLAIQSLAVISRAFKSLVFPSKYLDEEHGVATFLFQSLQQSLQIMVSSIWCTHPEILDGVIQICKEAVGVGGQPMLEGVVAVLLQIFRCGRAPSAALFDLLSEMIEVHYSDDESMNGIMAISKAAFDNSFSILHNGGISSEPTMVAGILNTGYSSLVYAPSKILETGSFPVCIDLGIAALACRESPEVIVHALELLAYLPSAIMDESLPQNARRTLERSILDKGEHMMEALLFSLCETCPRSKITAVSQLIKSLLTQEPFMEPSKQWLYSALQSNLSLIHI